MPTVFNKANLRQTPENAVYVGRTRSDFHFGNPFSHLRNSLAEIHVPTRAESLTCFSLWLAGTDYQSVAPERRKWILEHLKDLKGKDLICHCRPQPCHGEILMQLANEA